MDGTKRMSREEELRIVGDRMDEARALGAIVEVDPEDADDLALVEETAIDWKTGVESRFDHLIFDENFGHQREEEEEEGWETADDAGGNGNGCIS